MVGLEQRWSRNPDSRPPCELDPVLRTQVIERRERAHCGFGGGSHNEKIPRRLYCPGYGEALMNLPPN